MNFLNIYFAVIFAFMHLLYIYGCHGVSIQ